MSNTKPVELMCLPQTRYRSREKAGRYFWDIYFGDVYFVPKGKQKADQKNFGYLTEKDNNYEAAMRLATRLLAKKLKSEAIDNPSTVS